MPERVLRCSLPRHPVRHTAIGVGFGRVDRATDHALLVEGFPGGEGARFELGRLAALAEVLRAAGSPWTVRTLGPTSLPRGSLHDELADACVRANGCLLVVIRGPAVRTHDPGWQVSPGSGPAAAFSFAELASSSMVRAPVRSSWWPRSMTME